MFVILLLTGIELILPDGGNKAENGAATWGPVRDLTLS